MKTLSSFSVDLSSNEGHHCSGHAGNVLGGPLQALSFLVEEIARHSHCEPLRAGETVTTGTLTEAVPVVLGAMWTAGFSGIDLQPLRLRFF